MDAYTIPEAASALRVSPREVRTWIEEGRLRAFEVHGRWRIPVTEVSQAVERPPELRGGSAEAGGPLEEAGGPLEEAVAELRAELATLRGRVEALEQGSDEPPPPGFMRPSLAPLFRGPGAGG
jgi:excisionase family DNA binding protein